MLEQIEGGKDASDLKMDVLQAVRILFELGMKLHLRLFPIAGNPRKFSLTTLSVIMITEMKMNQIIICWLNRLTQLKSLTFLL